MIPKRRLIWKNSFSATVVIVYRSCGAGHMAGVWSYRLPFYEKQFTTQSVGRQLHSEPIQLLFSGLLTVRNAHWGNMSQPAGEKLSSKARSVIRVDLHFLTEFCLVESKEIPCWKWELGLIKMSQLTEISVSEMRESEPNQLWKK